MKEKNKKREIILAIVIGIIMLFFLSGFSMGKEMNRTKIETTGKIAVPILKVENEEPIEITNKGQTGTYNFKVKNYNENNETTDVDMEYQIEILGKNNDIEMKMYKNETEINLVENQTEKFILSKEKMQEDNYRLEIKANKNSSASEILQEIQIKVHSEQKN